MSRCRTLSEALADLPDLSHKIVKSDEPYCGAGAFSDVYKRQYNNGAGLVEVAVKSFRFLFTLGETESDSHKKSAAIRKMIRRELGIWRRLEHPNIVPFLGIVYGFGRQGHASMVSLWMTNGSLQSFLGNYDDRLTIAHRLQLLLDIANGLCYLHSFRTPIIHGDLSCNNVLMDHNYNARLTDFGFASMVGEIPEASTYLQMTMRPGTIRWAAPEYFSSNAEQVVQPTTKSDIYSFGNIGLLVLSGEHPWSEIRNDFAVMYQLAHGNKPKKPSARPIEERHWELIQHCWSSIEDRPCAHYVVSSLQRFLHSFPPPLPLLDIFSDLFPSSSAFDSTFVAPILSHSKEQRADALELAVRPQSLSEAPFDHQSAVDQDDSNTVIPRGIHVGNGEEAVPGIVTTPAKVPHIPRVGILGSSVQPQRLESDQKEGSSHKTRSTSTGFTPPNALSLSPRPFVEVGRSNSNSSLILGERTHIQRNIIFIGETGAGKSSAINLLLEPGSLAPVSNNSRPCTQTNARYETMLNGTKYILWDTRGLDEKRRWYQYFFSGTSEKDLKTFLKERHRTHEIDLLVYCVRGSKDITTAVHYYNMFCSITRRLAAPVAIVVTQLEKDADMEGWWTRNSSGMRELGMVFDGHACITTLPGQPRQANCREKLADLITKNHRWEAKESRSYFGSPVQKSTSTPSAAPRKAGRARVDEEGLSRSMSNQSTTASATLSQTGSSYHTADSPTALTPSKSSPTDPVTPRSATSPVKVPHNIDTKLPESNHPPHPSSEETPSHMFSLFHSSLHSSDISHSEVNMEPPTEEREDYYFSELPFKQSTATVRRRQPYATRSGAFGDIWECDLLLGESTRIVAVKAIRTNISDTEDSRAHEKKLRRELRVWGKLRHRNIVPLLGVVSGFGRFPSPISMSNKHRLLGDIALGLRYLHKNGIVHGDLHSDNVLIDDDETACLTDFSLSFISEFLGTSYLKSGVCGVIYFVDPTLVKRAYTSQDDTRHPTKSCDIYSFGGIMLHVLSGKRPYDGIPSPAVLMTIVNGERPKIPIHNHITESHRSLIRMCWHPEERKRPSADDLVRKFGRT